MTFGFGLLHGFGFASVLGELDLPLRQFVLALLQFNLGLELGQVAIVLAAVSLMFAARNSLRYVPVVIRGGSAAAIAVALLWFVEAHRRSQATAVLKRRCVAGLCNVVIYNHGSSITRARKA